jgi:hypothetical protein
MQSVCVLIFFLCVGSVAETHPHWTILAYPTAAICLAAFYVHSPAHLLNRRLKLLAGASLTSLVLAAVIGPFALEAMRQTDPKPFGRRWGAKLAGAQQRLFGWRDVDATLSRYLREVPDEAPLLFTHRQDHASLLNFHRNKDLVINLAPLLENESVSGTSQRFYVDYAALRRECGVYFGEDHDWQPDFLREVFEQVEELSPMEVKCDDVAIHRYRIFRVSRLSGMGFERAMQAGSKTARPLPAAD